MDYISICEQQLPVDEGVRPMPYHDSLGLLSIGIGRNLAKGLSQDEIALLFKNDLDAAARDAASLVPSFHILSEVRKAVICNMVFNMGKARVSAFVQMLGAIADEDFNKAADQMLASKWATQVGSRAIRLAKMMRDG